MRSFQSKLNSLSEYFIFFSYVAYFFPLAKRGSLSSYSILLLFGSGKRNVFKDIWQNVVSVFEGLNGVNRQAIAVYIYIWIRKCRLFPATGISRLRGKTWNYLLWKRIMPSSVSCVAIIRINIQDSALHFNGGKRASFIPWSA